MKKKNEPKKSVTKKEETKAIKKATVKVSDGEVDVYAAKEPTQIDSQRVEVTESILKTWNAIGIVIHTELYDTYTLNNIYVILEDALKKIKLAHT